MTESGEGGLTPLKGKNFFDRIFDSKKPTEIEPNENLGTDSEHLAKTAEKFQFENVPKALKNTAKIIMKVVTAPPAFVLDFGGGILKNTGFFMRAVPMALGGAIGEKISPQYKKIGENIGFALASPITVPALAIETLGRCAELAGSLHMKGNITEELDLGVYMKFHLLDKTPKSIMDEYVKEIRHKNPTMSAEEINNKIQNKFRNQGKDFENLKYTEFDRQFDDSLKVETGELKAEDKKIEESSGIDMEEEMENLKYRFDRVGNVSEFVNAVGELVKRDSEKMHLSPETTKERVDSEKTEALIYCMNKKAGMEEKLFFIIGEDEEYEFRNGVLNNLQKNLELSNDSLEIVKKEGEKIAERLEGQRKLEAYVKKVVVLLTANNKSMAEVLKTSSIINFLKTNDAAPFFRENMLERDLLKAQCKKLGLSNKSIRMIFAKEEEILEARKSI